MVWIENASKAQVTVPTIGYKGKRGTFRFTGLGTKQVNQLAKLLSTL